MLLFGIGPAAHRRGQGGLHVAVYILMTCPKPILFGIGPAAHGRGQGGLHVAVYVLAVPGELPDQVELEVCVEPIHLRMYICMGVLGYS